MLDRCGPKPSMIARSLAGSVAIIVSSELVRGLACRIAPHRPLRKAEQRTTTAWADLLVVLGTRCGVHLVGEPELAFDGREVAHHGRGGVWLPASAALRLIAAGA